MVDQGPHQGDLEPAAATRPLPRHTGSGGEPPGPRRREARAIRGSRRWKGHQRRASPGRMASTLRQHEDRSARCSRPSKTSQLPDSALEQGHAEQQKADRRPSTGMPVLASSERLLKKAPERPSIGRDERTAQADEQTSAQVLRAYSTPKIPGGMQQRAVRRSLAVADSFPAWARSRRPGRRQHQGHGRNRR